MFLSALKLPRYESRLRDSINEIQNRHNIGFHASVNTLNFRSPPPRNFCQAPENIKIQCTLSSFHLQCRLQKRFQSCWKTSPCLFPKCSIISFSCKPVAPQKRQLAHNSSGLQELTWQEKPAGGTTVGVAGEERRLTTPCSIAKCSCRECRLCRSLGDLQARHLKE